MAQDWYGRPWPGSVLYELDVGSFTPEGTLDAAADHLTHLVDLGVDFVELVGVESDEGLRGFVDACHERGLGVLRDLTAQTWGDDPLAAVVAGLRDDGLDGVRLDV